MTTVYFIRHAQSNSSVHDDLTRPLTEKGLNDCALVTEFLRDKKIDAVFSSPFKRSIDTVSEFAQSAGLGIELVNDFSERKIADVWIEDFMGFAQKQWIDFSYKLPSGECLAEVQGRNIAALGKILILHKNKNIVIGTHGTALSAIINYYDDTFGFKDFKAMASIMPWAVKMTFVGNDCAGMEKIDLFQPLYKPGYEECDVRAAKLGSLKAYRFVVIFARHQSKWLYCRAKTRNVYETAGGRIEQGETPLEAAKRELYEETGAVAFDITPVFDYSVHIQTEYSNGQVFLADIRELGTMPGYEMAEVKLFDTIPDKMRFPKILPALFAHLQGWLNLQTAKDELWDVYDVNRQLTGRMHRRGDPLQTGDYHLVVDIWLQNSEGKYLITKRATNKGFPNLWECTGGSAVAGDDSITTAIKEVKEETGLDIKCENGTRVISEIRADSILDVWLFRHDFDLKDVILQEGETADAKYATIDEIRAMMRNNEFIPCDYFEGFIARVLSDQKDPELRS